MIGIVRGADVDCEGVVRMVKEVGSGNIVKGDVPLRDNLYIPIREITYTMDTYERDMYVYNEYL